MVGRPVELEYIKEHVSYGLLSKLSLTAFMGEGNIFVFENRVQDKFLEVELPGESVYKL